MQWTQLPGVPFSTRKLFLAKRKKTASLIIGSANLTYSGLHNNVEAGAILDLDLSQADDKNLLSDLLKIFENLPARFPEHVFQVKDLEALEKLFDDGRLIDEDISEPPPVTAYVRKGTRDTLKPMGLPRHTPPPRKRVALKPEPQQHKTPAQKPPPHQWPEFVLIWESRGLTERDLNIPTGSLQRVGGTIFGLRVDAGADVGVGGGHGISPSNPKCVIQL